MRDVPMTEPRLLVIEDSPDYATLVTELLREAFGPKAHVEVATSLAEATDALAAQVRDCALVDLTLPDADGLEPVRTLRAAAPGLPLVVLSGVEDEQVALEAMREGAQDYLLKGVASVELLRRAVLYAIERVRIESELVRLSLYDALTGLPNRQLLEDRIQHALARADRSDQQVAVFFVDIDNFKLINDANDHRVGDEVLKTVAERLAAVVRPEDTVGRFGGDEFVIVCERTDPDLAATLAGRLLEALRRAVGVADGIYVTGSIGIAFGAGSATVAELVRDADTAMYRAKQRGGGTFAFHDAAVRERAVGRMRLQTELRRALERDELRLFYQPIVSLDDGLVVGAEALVRWMHPEHGLLEPAAFIPLAEQNGLIVAIGQWVLCEACRQLGEWQGREDAEPPIVSVNVSARQLSDGGLVTAVREALEAHSIDPALLCLEITETSVMLEPELAAETLRILKDQVGVSIALDDFGTGYSSLSQLGRIPVDLIKIDRSFMTPDPNARRIVQAVVGLAHALDKTPVAEGVELLGQVSDLRELGCERAQGFLFARPQPAEQVAPLLGQRIDPAS